MMAPASTPVLNGMGDDGHTLSSVASHACYSRKTGLGKFLYLDAQQMYRITLTAPVREPAAKVAFLTFGANKS